LHFLHGEEAMMLRVGLLLMSAAMMVTAQAQQIAAAGPLLGTISGTVLDVDGGIVPGAVVTLQCASPCENKTAVADENAGFAFRSLTLGVPYQIRVSMSEFEPWTSAAIFLTPDHPVDSLNDIALKVTHPSISVTVYASSTDIATEQVHIEEQQRVLGFIPNFYVVYDSQNAAPLTAKLKFKLAMRVSVDPVTLTGVAFMAGVRQMAETPNYQLGAIGYGQRVGAEAADGFSDLLIGGAILPSILHQDPRYFYQGTGTARSRWKHALSSPFICRGDNGRWQPNYSSLGGDLAASALMTTYYPESNRGAGTIFGQFGINTGERALSGVVQEFVLRKLTPHAQKAQ
jgi:hypothetical protein